MEPTLLVYKSLHRDAFKKETFSGQDDILVLVENGSFVFDSGSGPQQAGPLDAVNFRQNVTYQRRITAPADLHLFRYRTDTTVFDDDAVRFRDQERIRSTLQLLHTSDGLVHLDDFACKRTLFADIINQYCLENAARRAEASHTDVVVSSAIAHINNNLHQKINLTQLASGHYLSYIQFFRRFKRVTGATPQDYVTGLRLKKAQLLLSETDLPVKQIAKDCGFCNEYYFSSFFHSRCSLSPTRYRAMVQTTDTDPPN